MKLMTILSEIRVGGVGGVGGQWRKLASDI